MTIEYVKNGDFRNDLKDWKLEAPDSTPQFSPHNKGQSILLPVNAALVQSIPDLPDETVTVSFDVCWGEESEIPIYSVSFGGVASDGYSKPWPYVDLAGKEWQSITTKITAGSKLTDCSIVISTAKPREQETSNQELPKFGSIRIARLSLTTG